MNFKKQVKNEGCVSVLVFYFPEKSAGVHGILPDFCRFPKLKTNPL